MAKVRQMEQRETGRKLRDNSSRLTKLETQEYLTAANGTWTPVITGSTGDPTITYTENVGRYTILFDTIVFYSFRIVINAYSGGSGNLRVSLPIACSNINAADLTRAAANLSGVDVTPTEPYGLSFRPELGQAYGVFQVAGDNVATVIVAVTEAAAGDTIAASGWYWK